MIERSAVKENLKYIFERMATQSGTMLTDCDYGDISTLVDDIVELSKEEVINEFIHRMKTNN